MKTILYDSRPGVAPKALLPGQIAINGADAVLYYPGPNGTIRLLSITDLVGSAQLAETVADIYASVTQSITKAIDALPPPVISVDGVATPATSAQIQNGFDNTAMVTSAGLAAAGAEEALTDAATIAWDMSKGFQANVVLGGNRILGVPTNAIAGRGYLLRIVQDGTGNRTIAWSSCYKWGAAQAPILGNVPNKEDIVQMYCVAAGNAPMFDCFFCGRGF